MSVRTAVQGVCNQLLLSHGRVRGAVFGAYGEWSWDVEWLLEEAASRAAQTSGRAWATDGPRRHARSFSSGTYRRRMGITVVRAMARHRWRHSQYVGLTRVQLEHSRRRADREHQRQAREQAERRSEVVRMAEHYFPWRPGGERDGGRAVSRRSLICVRSLPDVCFTTV